MTRKNEIMFTASKTGARVLAKWFVGGLGELEVLFRAEKIAGLDLVDPGPQRKGPVPPSFLEWLDRFEGLCPCQRWNLLAPGGSPFRRRVWRALLEIPPGTTASYGEVAAAIGRPGAARAVGRAVGGNPIALLIPCHRIVPSSGGTGGYRWGGERKQGLLEMERRPCFRLREVFVGLKNNPNRNRDRYRRSEAEMAQQIEKTWP
jgi:O-6-methylguanine DNA methyltransferase